MPLPMVHLDTAYALLLPEHEKTPAFWLGCIAPDAVHMRPDFVREHPHDARDIRRIGNLRPLVESIRAHAPDRDFRLGYLVHLLTDIFWLDSVHPSFSERYAADPAPVQEQKKWAYYNDTDPLDFALFQREPWREEVWQQLSWASPAGIDGILRPEDAAAWNQGTLHWYDSGKSAHTYPVKYITYEDLTAFMRDAAERVRLYLGNENPL